MVYTNYKPHLLKDDVFPIPPPGYEYFEMKVHAMIESNNDEEVDTDGIEKMGYEVSDWKPELNDILVCRNIVDNILLENEPLNNERIRKLLNIDHSLLNNIDKMITVSDPCNVRCNLAMHYSVTSFIIRQPICRPHLLERVYKPMRTPR